MECKITVLETCIMEEIAQQIGKEKRQTPCPVFQKGQVFYTEKPFGGAMPQGFCPIAWLALEVPVHVLSGGGKYLGFEEKTVVACPDGLRPVLFLVEPEKGE